MRIQLTGILVASLAVVGLISQPASAVMTLNWNHGFGSTNNNPTGATGAADFTFSDQAGGVYIDIQLFNTTPTSLGSELVGITFDVPSTFDNDDFDLDKLNSNFKHLKTNYSFPGVGTFDLATGIRNNFQGGNPNPGIDAGDDAVFRLILDTNYSATQVEDLFIDGYSSGSLKTAARFQAIGPGGKSDKLSGGYTPGDDPDEPDDDVPSGVVPEPMTTTLGLLGLAGLGIATRRRR